MTDLRNTETVKRRAANLMVDAWLNWSAYACVLCGRMAACCSLLCEDCGRPGRRGTSSHLATSAHIQTGNPPTEVNGGGKSE
jgi:hypothetical protein